MARVKGLLALLIVGAFGVGVYRIALALWAAVQGAQPTVAAASIAAAASVVVSTLTVMIGRYFERRKELEALYREKKMPIYADFLKALVSQFQGGDANSASAEGLVSLLKQWHIDIILWGGPDVVNAYLNWKATLNEATLTASTLAKMDNLIFAIRSELGNTNRGLPTGLFARLTLRHPELLLTMTAANPAVTLPEIAAREKELGLVK
jgi:hypothetical protein